MKLLSKQELDTAKASDRKREVDEGVKLARKVDRLRETAASEQTALNNHRATMLREIEGQIKSFEVARDALVEELAQKTEERNTLLVPLKQKEEALAQQEKHLHQVHLGQSEDMEIILEMQSGVDKRYENLLVEEQRMAVEKERTSKSLGEAEQMRKEAADMLKEASRRSVATDTDIEARTSALSFREENVAVAERGLALQKQQVVHDQKEIGDRERAVNDKYQTLIRSTNRLKHGTNGATDRK